LFRWFCAALLLSARIKAGLAMRAAASLAEHGLTTAQRMARASWDERTVILNRAGYARYDESTSRILGDTSAFLVREYGGDLRRLRETAGRDAQRERQLLMQCKGIGGVGADIFLREVQEGWGEAYPFVDARARRAASRLGLGEDAQALSKLVDRADFPRLVAALIRADLAREIDRLREEAA
jgi:endonuclease III